MSDEPDLKPGLGSTTFWGKVVLQVFVLINAMLKASGKQALDVPAELSLAIATALEMTYQSWRHWNRRVVNQAKAEIAVARAEVAVAESEVALARCVCPKCNHPTIGVPA